MHCLNELSSLALLLAGVVVALTRADRFGDATQCGGNETYSTCAPHLSCEPSCLGGPLACPLICRFGCTCTQGFLRDNGKCVAPSDCSNVTATRIPRQLQCKTDAECAVDQICNAALLRCAPGRCVGRCVPRASFASTHAVPTVLPATLSEAVAADDARAAPNRCPQLTPPHGPPPPGCKYQTTTDENGCARLSTVCERSTEGQCASNETFSTCAPHPRCEPSCLTTPLACPALCRIGCTCAQGFMRDDSGKCVAQSDCNNVAAAASNAQDVVCKTDAECDDGEMCNAALLRCIGCSGRCVPRPAFAQSSAVTLPASASAASASVFTK